MILQIADWLMEVSCGNEVADRLQNLKPFLLPEMPVCSRSHICRLELGYKFPIKETGPDAVHHPDGRTIRIWLTADYCYIALTPYGSPHTYWLRTDRRWRNVQTDLLPETSEDYALLNDFIMISFIYSAAFHGGALIHASCVAIDDKGVAFVGPSGIGKSTHSQLWLKHIAGARLLNDDQPILRLMPGGEVMLFGSPWSGKTSCYINEGVRLETIFRMEQAEENRAVRMDGIEAFRMLLSSTSLIGRDSLSFAVISGTLAQIAGSIPTFTLYNKPEQEAALLSYNIFKDK
mgnify:FL=1